MTLPELKNFIITKQPVSTLIIFKCEDEDFIPLQYIEEISKYTNSQIVHINNLQDYPINGVNNMFEDSVNSLYIYKEDGQLELDEDYKQFNNLFIICNKVSKDTAIKFKDSIIDVPKLEEWQLKDYALVICPGIEENQADWLSKNCSKSAYRLTKEIQKLLPFPVSTRKDLFNSFMQENIFNPAIDINTFDFVSAVQTKNIDKIKELLPKVEIVSMGLVSLLYTSFRNIIKVWLTKYPTETNTGLTNKQIWAINKLPKNYSKEQLLKIFEMLTGIDFRLKNGDIQENLINDYVITSILTA